MKYNILVAIVVAFLLVNYPNCFGANKVNIFNADEINYPAIKIEQEVYTKHGNHYRGITPILTKSNLARVYNMNGERIGTVKIEKQKNRYVITDYESWEESQEIIVIPN